MNQACYIFCSLAITDSTPNTKSRYGKSRNGFFIAYFMPDQAVTLRPIEALIPYARNSRTHSGAQVAQIAASIVEFGFVGAIVVREGVIAKGHGTLSAARKIYESGGLVYPAPGKSAGAKPFEKNTCPVLDVSGWTESQFRAYVIADNKLAENAGWDAELLESELQSLHADSFDMGLLGFSAQELELSMGIELDAPASSTKEIDPDDYKMGCKCPKCGFEFDDK